MTRKPQILNLYDSQNHVSLVLDATNPKYVTVGGGKPLKFDDVVTCRNLNSQVDYYRLEAIQDLRHKKIISDITKLKEQVETLTNEVARLTSV